MIYIDDNTKDKLKKLEIDSIYFLVNFDNVITNNNSIDTWSVITSNIKLKKACMKKIEDLNFKCKSIELDSKLGFDDKCDCIKNVWKENIDLYKELNIDDNKIKRCICKKININIREGVKNFLKLTYEKNIPVIIVSDGISEIINFFLSYNNCDYDNIYIISNSILFDTDMNKIIHPLNKNESSISNDIKDLIKNKTNCILLASSINDINMLSKAKLKDSIKIVFLDKNINENFDTFLNYFNIICTHNTSFDLLVKKMNNI
ncbi:MAG: hypothetical protein PHD15_00480 [Clostridia bacterium]|nr:hypothetical protein [Clostridia bacterium]MDD4386227.1 hypothetical protein [Clostridia bacterium]